ncbi:MAG: hypothetical protein AB7E60_00985 [Sphingobium sp.]
MNAYFSRSAMPPVGRAAARASVALPPVQPVVPSLPADGAAADGEAADREPPGWRDTRRHPRAAAPVRAGASIDHDSAGAAEHARVHARIAGIIAGLRSGTIAALDHAMGEIDAMLPTPVITPSPFPAGGDAGGDAAALARMIAGHAWVARAAQARVSHGTAGHILSVPA